MAEELSFLRVRLELSPQPALQDLAASRMPQEPVRDTLPAWGARLRVELDHARLGRLELRAADVRRQVALALGEKVLPWPDGPLLLSHAPTAPEDLSRLELLGGKAARVPLGEVASIHLRPGPDCVLRLGPRRLVAYASLMDNRDKADLVRRIILGVASTGVSEIVAMPDYYGLVSQAAAGLGRDGGGRGRSGADRRNGY